MLYLIEIWVHMGFEFDYFNNDKMDYIRGSRENWVRTSEDLKVINNLIVGISKFIVNYRHCSAQKNSRARRPSGKIDGERRVFELEESRESENVNGQRFYGARFWEKCFISPEINHRRNPKMEKRKGPRSTTSSRLWVSSSLTSGNSALNPTILIGRPSKIGPPALRPLPSKEVFDLTFLLCFSRVHGSIPVRGKSYLIEQTKSILHESKNEAGRLYSQKNNTEVWSEPFQSHSRHCTRSLRGDVVNRTR
ncbi:hypothetical protein NE237_021577 [Protea cynaroides]|uniref:Uncharacterized protein n=1 Tax=Protea cynaroides TaxID=273540 RepID=A0A9Q0K3N4_9MAGN|nr:hypothetical protein NE237_021577 [Protea cynaroides]